MADSIPQSVLNALKQVGEETGKELISETGKIAESIISGRELLGDIQPMSPEQLQRAKAEDEQKAKAEADELKRQMGLGGGGRDVQQEMLEIHRQQEQKEQEEEEFLQRLKEKREAEAMELVVEEPENAQRNRAKMANMPRGKKKSMMPDPAAMSQTSEFKGKID